MSFQDLLERRVACGAAVARSGMTANILDRAQAKRDDRIDNLLLGNSKAMADDTAARSLGVCIGAEGWGDLVHNEIHSQQHCIANQGGVKRWGRKRATFVQLAVNFRSTFVQGCVCGGCTYFRNSVLARWL